MKLLRMLLVLGSLPVASCASTPEPYRIHSSCKSSCRGLTDSRTLVARTEVPGREPAACVIGFNYTTSKQAPFRLWITDTGEPDETVYVDVLGELMKSGETVSYSMDLDKDWTEWFKLRCTDVLGPLYRQEPRAKCSSNIRDGNWIHVAQRSDAKWTEGESHGPAPDSELYELQEAALALIAATAASPDLRLAHLVRLHLITDATERNPVPGTPRGEMCRAWSDEEYSAYEKKKNRDFEKECKNQRKKDASPTFARECEQRWGSQGR